MNKVVLKELNVGLSFYAFLANKNDNSELLMQAARVDSPNKLDHFGEVIKIKDLVKDK